jgi:AraC-like DNA-binding protein
VVWDREASHHYGNSAKPWDHSWLHVEGSWIERRLRQTPVPLGVAVEVGHAQPLRYWRMLHDELRGGVRQDPDMIEALLQLFWLDLERQFRTGPAGRRADPRLERARRFIELHFDRPFHLADAARQAHLAPSHFCSRFSRQYGVPPREYAMRLRMQRGAQLLANQELAVREVAEMVGCEDALYFSRLFRRRYGVSPRQFRRAA